MVESQNITNFIEEFNKFEDYLRREGGYASHDTIATIINREAARNRIIQQHKGDLDSFRELRNALVHQRGVYQEPFAEPYPATIERLKKIINLVINPPTAHDISIKTLAFAQNEASLIDTLATMKEKGYTVMPVLDYGIVQSVLSEYSLLKWISSEAADDGATLVARTVGDINEYLDKPDYADSNASYFFISKSAPSIEAITKFEEAVKGSRRLNAGFVTHSGKPTERVLGIITAWDVVNSSKL